MFKQLAFAAFAAFALSGVASARELTDEDWAALEELVVAHEAALHAKDAGAVIDVFPPAVLPLIAQMSGGVEVDVARQQGIDMMMAAAEGASFDAFDIDYDNAVGPYELSDGTTYVLLPTKMVDLPGDGTKLKDEVSVAVLVEEKWYLMGFDTGDEVQLLVAAYPAFAEPDFMTNFTAVLGGAADSASAGTLTDEESAALEERIATFDTAMHESNWAEVMSVVPTKVLNKFATDAGITTEDLLTQMATMMDESLKQVTIESFGMSLETATQETTADGTPYVLIPTETVIDMGEAGKVKALSMTLAFMDEGQWFLVRTEDALTMDTLKVMYPSFVGVEVPPGTTEIVTE